MRPISNDTTDLTSPPAATIASEKPETVDIPRNEPDSASTSLNSLREQEDPVLPPFQMERFPRTAPVLTFPGHDLSRQSTVPAPPNATALPTSAAPAIDTKEDKITPSPAQQNRNSPTTKDRGSVSLLSERRSEPASTSLALSGTSQTRSEVGTPNDKSVNLTAEEHPPVMARLKSTKPKNSRFKGKPRVIPNNGVAKIAAQSSVGKLLVLVSYHS